MSKSKWFFGAMFLLGLPISANAECSGRCYDLYCGPSGSHGYCTDYVEHRLGARQGGDGGSWSGNINSDDVQSNDVAIFDFGTYGHVAVVDSVSVDGEDITISEWNWGGCGTDKCDSACAVTDTYGETTSRIIAKSAVMRFWRPNSSSDSADGKIPYTGVSEGNTSIYWTPTDVSCVNAGAWYYNGTSTAYENGICWDAYEELKSVNWSKYILSDWHDTFFGNQQEFLSTQNCSAN